MCVTEQRHLNRDKKFHIIGKVPYTTVKKKNLAFLHSCQIALANHNNERFQLTQGQDNGVRAGDTEQLV